MVPAGAGTGGECGVIPGETSPISTLIWCDREQGDLVEGLTSRCNLNIVGVGCPTGAATAEVATRMEVPRAADLRHCALNETFEMLLMCRPCDLTRDELTQVIGRCQAIVTLEPIESLLGEKSNIDAVRRRVHFVPAMRFGKAFRFVKEIREQFGAIRSVTVATRGRIIHGSLLSRLVDALDVVEHLCGPIEQVDAAMSGRTNNQPESIQALHGHITANARFSQNCCASLSVSDDAGVWQRGIAVLGDGGCIRVTDTDLYWHDCDGRCVDESKVEALKSLDAESLPVALIGDQIKLILESARSGATGREPHPSARLLAVAEAMRLSIRTGQCESPRKIEELMRFS